MVVHLRGDVTAVAVREGRSRLAPRAGVGVAALDVLGDVRAGEPPNGDSITVPEMRKDTTGLVVEWVAECRGVVLQVGAASVGVGRALAGGVDKVGGRVNVAGRASTTGVEGDLIVRSKIDILWIYMHEHIPLFVHAIDTYQ